MTNVIGLIVLLVVGVAYLIYAIALYIEADKQLRLTEESIRRSREAREGKKNG